MLDRVEDTIVALSSARGASPVGLLRVSGPIAYAVVDPIVRLTNGLRLEELPGDSRVSGRLRLDPEGPAEVPVSLYLYRAPRSYTRQDVIEIHTIGSPPLLDIVQERIVNQGARLAEPGEFTARAFLNGSLSLDQAEAVMSLLHAQTDSQLRAARRLREGVLHSALAELSESLVDLLALIEAGIDFADEPIEFISSTQVVARLSDLAGSMDRLLSRAVPVEGLAEAPRILLFGPPNAGKSTLMNRLSGVPRSICAALAGTTRDVVSAPVSLGDADVILLDAAGVDDDPDPLTRLGRAQTMSAAESADLICLVVDASNPDRARRLPEQLPTLDPSRIMVVVNKADLVDSESIRTLIQDASLMTRGPVVAVSALTGQGIHQFKIALGHLTRSLVTTVSDETVVLSARQRNALTSARQALERSLELAGASDAGSIAELLSLELREALDSLGLVTGSVTTEDLLGHVFSRFCIGK